MDGPIVESLTYSLVVESYPLHDIRFAARSPLDWSNDLFSAHLEDDTLVLQLKPDLSERDARNRVEQLLLAWSVDAGLAAGRPVFTFHYFGSTTRPDAGGTRSVGRSLELQWSIEENIQLEDYAPPPTGFAVSPLVDILWARFSAYKKGQETLAAMAYVCLSLLENEAGRTVAGKKRLAASELFGLHPKVLGTLGTLVSTIGDLKTARKAPEQERPYTSDEVAWIEAAVAAIIRQAGRLAFDPSASLPVISMANLPDTRILTSAIPTPTDPATCNSEPD